MKTICSRIAIIASAAAMTMATIIPASAMPLPVAPASQPAAYDVTDVQYHRPPPPHHGMPRHYAPHHSMGRPGYYNGHRGYREHRPGYRYHNGFWFPLAAFGAGAIIGGAIANSGPHGNRHVAWCESRYRTYRPSDNTYVSSPGVRRSCVSPY